MDSTDNIFSATYAEARTHFVDLATQVGARKLWYPIDVPTCNDLTIDIAIIGPDRAPTVMISSGTHGVEGFFGSAVQLAFLQRIARSKPPSDVRFVLSHALNPYGFSKLRRCNEDNVDLNRNFLYPPAQYSGAPADYDRLNAFLNPTSTASRYEPFLLKSLWVLGRMGRLRVKQAIAGGQYKYPKGLFFGGTRPSQSARCVFDHCDEWIADSPKIIHIDLHTGLGKYGSYKLLLVDDESPESIRWYASTFGAEQIELGAATAATSYRISGAFGDWMQKHFAPREYRFVTAEFGTYNEIRVLRSLRAENRVHHYDSENNPRRNYHRAKRELMECFCPDDPRWRLQAVQSALTIIDQAITSFAL